MLPSSNTSEENTVRLILIEDSDDDVELIGRELTSGGIRCEIRRVQALVELGRALADFRPDAVLCDYLLPGFTAPEALALVRSSHPNLPFLCVSGSVGEGKIVTLLKDGATDCVLKDRLARLPASLRRALEQARERADRLRAEEELSASREQLLQAQKMEAVGRLAGGVAHDFNNILTTISGYAELLNAALPSDSPHREDVNEILAASARAAQLTRQLLAFGRRQVLEMRVLDLNEIVRGVSRMLTRVIGEDVRIELALAPDLRRVRADSGQLETVLMNLAVNARDAMPKGGHLKLATRADGDFVELTVTDDGLGMSAEVRARLFEPFFTTKEKGKGTGLGLSTAYGVVRQSDGTIDVESSPGRGATFRIRLPATDEEADSVRVGAPAAAAGGRETVLVIEDEAPLRQLLVRVLGELGYHVIPAAGAKEALAASAETAGIDAAVVDVIMPELDGPSLVARLRESRPSLKALFISGYADQVRLPEPESGKSYPFLAKPFTSAALAAKLREMLDARP
ncbi:MAG: response regulator [Elusimicrobia bacterium]|nr:response regulator [Elusimicrobiota bacterium]